MINDIKMLNDFTLNRGRLNQWLPVGYATMINLGGYDPTSSRVMSRNPQSPQLVQSQVFST